MTSATKVSIGTPLYQAYIKPPRKVSVIDPNTKVPIEQPNMSPVLYHGTVRYVVEQWKKECIRNKGLSVISDAVCAASFARYKIGDRFSMTVDSIFLENPVSRKLYISRYSAKEQGLLDEYKNMCGGQIVHSLVMFDRDRLLDNISDAYQNGFCAIFNETDGSHLYPGIRIKWNAGLPDSIRFIPFSSIFASLEVHIPSHLAEIRVFNLQLWEENFSVEVPSLRHLSGRWPVDGRADIMELASLLFVEEEPAPK